MESRGWALRGFALAFALLLVGVVGGSPRSARGQSSTEITWTSWRTDDIQPNNEIIAEFNKEHPEIKIRFTPVKSTEYDAQLRTALAGGVAADIIQVRAFGPGKVLYDNKYVIPINEKVPTLKNYVRSSLKAWTGDDGKIYAVPVEAVSAAYLYNKAIFGKYGLQPPGTWDEFTKLLETLKKNGVTPLAIGTKDAWPVVIALGYFNVGPNIYGGEPARNRLLAGKAKFTDPKFVEVFEKLLALKPYFPDGFQAISYPDMQQMFAIERAAIFPSGSWEVNYFRRVNPKLDFGVFPPMVMKAGDKRWIMLTPDGGLGINASSKHQDAALVFLNWATSQKFGKLWANKLAGQFPYAPGKGTLSDDPLISIWTKWFGANLENTTYETVWEKLNDKEPTGYTLLKEAMVDMFAGRLSPEQAAAHVQSGLASWYPLFPKK